MDVTRRELLSAAAGVLLHRQPMDLSALPRIERATPWNARAKELEETEGPYCDYTAWEEWIRKQLGEFYGCDSVWQPLDAFDEWMIAEKVALYAIMTDLVEKHPAQTSKD